MAQNNAARILLRVVDFVLRTPSVVVVVAARELLSSADRFGEFRKINVSTAHDRNYLSRSAFATQGRRNSASTSTFRNDMVSFCNDSQRPG